jgi:NAD(P)-dependent dehydrogenase (short-subunit alcohol dehydrogenase family)
MDDLAGRVAVVTGAAAGIGLSIAKTLASEGLDVVLADIDADRLEAARSEVAAIGARTLGVITDVRSARSVDALGEAALRAFGGVDVVCNNAGVWGLGTQWETSLDEWRRVMDVNLWGVIHGVRAFTPMLIDNPRGGHIVNTASLAGLLVGPFRGPYAASKHAIIGISRALRSDFKARRLPVGVTVICPGKVDTAIFDDVRPGGGDTAGSPMPDDVRRLRDVIEDADSVAPDVVGPMVRDAITLGQFWVFPGAHAQATAVRRDLADLLAALDGDVSGTRV